MRKVILFLIILIFISGCFREKGDNRNSSDNTGDSQIIEIEKKWPNASTTGITVENFDLKIVSGTIHTKSAGEVIEKIDLQARLYVDHPNVTIRNSRLSGDKYYAVYCTTSGTSLTIENCDITGGVKIGDGFIGRKNHLHGAAGKNFDDGWTISASHITIEDNLIDGMAGGEGAHVDGIQILSGDDITIRHNRIEAVSPPIKNGGVNAAIFFAPYNGEISNIIVDGNLLIEREGYYPLRINARGKVEVTNNTFVKGYLGETPYRILYTKITKWENNKYNTGEVIPIPPEVKQVLSIEAVSNTAEDKLEAGGRTTAGAVVVFSDGTKGYEADVWRSSNPSAATVNNKGVITGIAQGETEISAMIGGKIGKIRLIVTEKKI